MLSDKLTQRESNILQLIKINPYFSSFLKDTLAKYTANNLSRIDLDSFDMDGLLAKFLDVNKETQITELANISDDMIKKLILITTHEDRYHRNKYNEPVISNGLESEEQTGEDLLIAKVTLLINKAKESNSVASILDSSGKEKIIYMKKEFVSKKIFKENNLLEISGIKSFFGLTLESSYYSSDDALKNLKSVDDLFWKNKILKELFKKQFLRKIVFRVDNNRKKITLEEEYKDFQSLGFYFIDPTNYIPVFTKISECINDLEPVLVNQISIDKIDEDIERLADNLFEKDFILFKQSFLKLLKESAFFKDQDILTQCDFQKYLLNVSKDIKELDDNTLINLLEVYKNLDEIFLSIEKSDFFREKLKKEVCNDPDLILDMLFAKKSNLEIVYFVFLHYLKDNSRNLQIPDLKDFFVSCSKEGVHSTVNIVLSEALEQLYSKYEYFEKVGIKAEQFKITEFIGKNLELDHNEFTNNQFLKNISLKVTDLLKSNYSTKNLIHSKLLAVQGFFTSTISNVAKSITEKETSSRKAVFNKTNEQVLLR